MDIERLIEVLDPYTIQERGEMRWLFEIVSALQPHGEILEIGRAMGGSAALLAATGAHVISVDNAPQEPYAWARPDYMALATGTGAHITQMDGDAHATETYTEVVKWYIAHGLPLQVDALLIDGGHHHDDAARDLLMYGTLARPGGAIILHDIVSPHDEAVWYPKWLWARIKDIAGLQTTEFTDLVGGAGGWGVIYMPADQAVVGALFEMARGLMFIHPTF